MAATVGQTPTRIEAWKRRLDGWEQYKNAKPNIGHYFVHSLDAKGKLVGLITQNVDGLHSRAGLPDEKIVELHGSSRKVICLQCDREYDPDEVIKKLVGDFASPNRFLVRCRVRGNVRRPDWRRHVYVWLRQGLELPE